MGYQLDSLTMTGTMGSKSDPVMAEHGSTTQPRAIIHKQILDLAEERPTASMETIAEEVSGASVPLVERVLSKYGDPVESEEAEMESEAESVVKSQFGSGQKAEGSGDEEPSLPAFTNLTNTQQEIIEAINEYPTATQREIGERLDLTAPTICVHAKSIEQFEWDDRQKLAAKIMETKGMETRQNKMNGNDPVSNQHEIKNIEQRLEALEEEINGESRSLSLEPPFAHKVIHACISSDEISEEEELKIISSIIKS